MVEKSQSSKSYVFVFPGQGSQSVGMGFALAERFKDFGAIFHETLREADGTLGFSLSRLIHEGPDEQLKETEITQPALLTVSTAMGRWLKSKGYHADFALGHSLGEYSALVFAEAISFSNALKLVHLRGKLMAGAVPSGKGGMCALIGATAEVAEELCALVLQELPNVVLEPSAYNAPGQVVLSGNIEAIDKAVSLAKSAGARTGIKLEVSGPFHCSLLKIAGHDLGQALETVEIDEPRTLVISNVSAQVEKDATQIRKNLELQVSNAVRWEDSIKQVAKHGSYRFIEVGSGKVLTGLIKKILPDANCLALDAIQSLDEV